MTRQGKSARSTRPGFAVRYNLRILLFSAVLASGAWTMPAIAQPRPQIGNGTEHASATITAISAKGSQAQLLVTLSVDPGWHVSWRNPGETGLPTRLSWSLPAGVRAIGETWPVPLISHTTVGDTHTLEGDVPWLVDFRSDSASSTDRLVTLTMRYGICRDVCIPEQITVQGVLPGRSSARRAPIPAALQSRLATTAGVIAARRLSPTELCLERVPMWSPGVVPEVIADSGTGADATLRLREGVGARRSSARMAIPAGTQLRDSASVLFVRGLSGVTARLSFRAPVRHCRLP
jgi:Disulphide bond corrector protein DsbC